MKRRYGAMAMLPIFAIAFLGVTAQGMAASSIQWQTDYAKAKKMAGQKKIVMMDFSAVW